MPAFISWLWFLRRRSLRAFFNMTNIDSPTSHLMIIGFTSSETVHSVRGEETVFLKPRTEYRTYGLYSSPELGT
jgi:hypothetical protein